jgi:hypothetical protein
MAKEVITPEEKRYRDNVEEIACNIAKLSRQVTALLDGRLSRKAVLLLLANSSGHSQSTINDVLTAITNMEANFLKS